MGFCAVPASPAVAKSAVLMHISQAAGIPCRAAKINGKHAGSADRRGLEKDKTDTSDQ
ncbi:hypothetical protein [Sutterella wadsworthensis]|uniref:hypothetical protein n=1 Tax=Sutterella wadsworthensis TaxID=40545 RepID=UPI00242BDCAE|nr:hypothetical protein [Sutterella wadsworthensis]